MTTAELLSEPVEAARLRERSAFDRLVGEPAAPFVLFGAGTLGRKICGMLRRHDVVPLAFADNAATLHGKSIEGVPVLSPTEAVSRFGADALFIITIFRGAGDHGMAARWRQLAEAGCRRITTFLPLAWKWPDELLPHYAAALPSDVLAHADELQALAVAWTDARSKETFRQQLLWRLRGDFFALDPPAPDQYFPRDLFAVRRHERLVDAGAFDGDTLRALGPNFARAWAIEPDPKNAALLAADIDPRVTLLRCALGSRRGEIRFTDSGTVASAANGEGRVTVPVETLDALLRDENPTFVKLDIEGAESDALAGAGAVLARSRPLVAVCLYHSPDHLWRIPGILRKALPGHALALRAHQNDGFELVAYSIPPERCIDS